MISSRTPVRETPELMRRRLKAALRQARDNAGLTQQHAADQLEWSVSKIIRIEQGVVGISATDLRALLALYDVDDEQQVAELLKLARESKKQTWAEYRPVYSKESLTLFGTEGAARAIYKYEPTFVPGLFQTEEYARALLTGMGYNEQNVDLMVAARMERQQLLENDVRPDLHYILGEAVVSHNVGGLGVMRRQLDRILELSKLPGVTVQVLLFSAGPHPGMAEAFTIMEFGDPNLDDVLYLENAGGETITREQPELIAEYRNIFGRLETLSTKPEELESVLSQIVSTRFRQS